MSFLISYPSISSHYVNFFLNELWQIVIDHFSQTKQGMFRPPNDDTFSSVLTFDISGSESPPKESGWPQKHQDFISLLGSDGHPDQTAMVIAMVAESDLEQWSSSWSADADQPWCPCNRPLSLGGYCVHQIRLRFLCFLWIVVIHGPCCEGSFELPWMPFERSMRGQIRHHCQDYWPHSPACIRTILINDWYALDALCTMQQLTLYSW